MVQTFLFAFFFFKQYLQCFCLYKGQFSCSVFGTDFHDAGLVVYIQLFKRMTAYIFIHLLHFSTLHHDLGNDTNLIGYRMCCPHTCFHNCWFPLANLKILIYRQKLLDLQAEGASSSDWLITSNWFIVVGKFMIIEAIKLDRYCILHSVTEWYQFKDVSAVGSVSRSTASIINTVQPPMKTKQNNNNTFMRDHLPFKTNFSKKF